MEFVFPFHPSPQCPREFVYRKAVAQDVSLAALTGRQIQEFMGAGEQATLAYLGNRVEELSDVAVVLTELEGGHAYEWRVELRRSPLLSKGLAKMHVTHGYIAAQAVHDARLLAQSIASQALQSQMLQC
jgi:hypothetical protein